MSDIMKSIPFGQLTEWIFDMNIKKQVRCLESRKPMWQISQKQSEIFGRKLGKSGRTGSRSSYTACTESCGCILSQVPDFLN